MVTSPFSSLEDPVIRPKNISEFTGQENIIKNLSVFLKAATQREEALDHVLLYGPPGLGKTTLAQIIANEMMVKFKSTSGPLLTKSADIASILTNIKKHEVLFIDEIHRMNTKIEEILYPAMEDYCLDIIVGNGPSARTLKIDLPKFTLIGATTRYGLISKPLRDRFGISCRLGVYSTNSLCELIERASILMQMKFSADAIQEVAQRSRGTPRIALRLVKRIRDFAQISKIEIADKKFTCTILEKLGLDDLGLNQLDYLYLRFICKNYNTSPVGIQTIASALSEKRDSIEETIEPYLMQIGFLNRSPQGRQLTLKAIKHLQFNTKL